MKHTPGPWHVDKKRMLTAINNGPSDKPYKHIAMVNYYKSGDPITDVSIEEHIANAHLIAAAPELLEALEFIVSQIANKKNHEHTLGAYLHGVGYSMAKDAIAKAKGEQ